MIWLFKENPHEPDSSIFSHGMTLLAERRYAILQSRAFKRWRAKIKQELKLIQNGQA